MHVKAHLVTTHVAYLTKISFLNNQYVFLTFALYQVLMLRLKLRLRPIKTLNRDFYLHFSCSVPCNLEMVSQTILDITSTCDLCQKFDAGVLILSLHNKMTTGKIL